MTNEQLEAFVEKVKSDISFQENLKAATSPEDAIEIAKSEGFLITLEEIQSMQSTVVELSDEELEAASGGTMLLASITFCTNLLQLIDWHW